MAVTVSGGTAFGCGTLKARAKSTAASRKFIATPASSTRKRTQTGLRLKAPAMALSTAASERPRCRIFSASDSPSSPSIFTKPPSGIQLSE